MTTIRTILVPTDFSPHAAAALTQAIELAKPHGARIVLLHSYWVTISMASPDVWVIPADFVEKLRDGAQSELEQLQKRVSPSGVACELRLSASPVVAAILDAAEELPADVIAMGTHGHTGIKHALLGSVAERIVRLAPCPVMTVKARG